MSERSENSIQAARFVEGIKTTADLLAEGNKALSEIDPQVSQFIETDTSSEDFGRIKDEGTAEELAYRHDEIREGELDRAGLRLWANEVGGSYDPALSQEKVRTEADDIANEKASEIVAETFRHRALQRGDSQEDANKLVQDYRITQGDYKAASDRSDAIFDGVKAEKGGSGIIADIRTARAIGKAMKAAKQPRHV